MEDGTLFLYTEGWRETIACCLPADARDHYWRNGLHPFFEHLAPEGWLRARQARSARASDEDDLGLLLIFGSDCIGAVGVRAPGDLPVLTHGADLVEAAATTPGRTLSGVQKKLLVHRSENAFLTSHRFEDPATHIAKFNQTAYPNLVQNEDISLKLAREVLGEDEVTKAAIATIRDLEDVALVVERFDRRGDERLRLEDFAQILKKPHGRDFHGKYESSYEEAAGVISNHSARPRFDLDRYFRLVVFNFVIGNADAHLKNFSLLERPEGLRLSPAYDLVNTVIYPLEAETALEIAGRRRPLDTIDKTLLEEFGIAIGLPPEAVSASLKLLARRFKSARTPRLPPRIELDDFRLRYREVVDANLQRIFS